MDLRQQVVPLIHLVCRAWCKRKLQEKNGHVNSWGWLPCKRRDYHLSHRVWIMCCSHCAKIWLAYVRSIWDTCDVLQECFISFSENREANQSVGMVSHRLRCSCDSANRLWKELNLRSILFGKASHLKPEWECVRDWGFLSCHTWQTKWKRDYS